MELRPNGRRVAALCLTFGTVVIGFTDRANLALVAPRLAADLRLDSVRMGFILSAFGWAYVAFQLPGGWIVDRFSARRLYPLILGGWSFLTAALGLARGAGGLFRLRLGIGACEAPVFPANNRVVALWFPEGQRARAIGLYTSGQFVGLAFITPVLALLMAKFGWPAVFYATGAAGLLWSGAWWVLYRDPGADSALPIPVRTSVTPAELRAILGSRNLWGIILGHMFATVTLWFLLTWLPTYLVTYRGMSFVRMGFGVAVPYIGAFVGAIVGGGASDWLLRRGADLATARKTPVIAGLILSMCIIGANFVDRPYLIIFFMTLACFGHGFASLGWTFVPALSPRGLIGVTGGIYNFVGNLSAIFVPIVIGYLVRGGSFQPALVFICACATAGVLSYALLVRDLGPIPVPEGR